MSSFNNSKRNFKNESKYQDYPSLTSHGEKILIVGKTAPQPSVRYREVVCTAGITESGKWIRLYPISFRYMNFFRKYKKYQWIIVSIEKNRDDFRIDSYRPDLNTIELLNKPLPAGDWKERKKIILPTVSESFEDIKENYIKNKISLGIFKPKEIIDFIIEANDKDWSPRHKKILTQGVLFGNQPKKLEKIPFKFSYSFIDNNPLHNRHKFQIIDWEIYELYRGIKEKYSYSMDVILEKVRKKWFDHMWSKDRDSYFIVGSVYPYPAFVVLGVFWPPK